MFFQNYLHFFMHELLVAIWQHWDLHFFMHELVVAIWQHWDIMMKQR